MSTLRKVATCTVTAPTGVRYVFRSEVGWTSGMCLRIDRARRLLEGQAFSDLVDWVTASPKFPAGNFDPEARKEQ